MMTKMPPIEHVALFDEAQRAWDLSKQQFYASEKE